eukprot:791616_1
MEPTSNKEYMALRKQFLLQLRGDKQSRRHLNALPKDQRKQFIYEFVDQKMNEHRTDNPNQNELNPIQTTDTPNAPHTITPTTPISITSVMEDDLRLRKEFLTKMTKDEQMRNELAALNEGERKHYVEQKMQQYIVQKRLETPTMAEPSTKETNAQTSDHKSELILRQKYLKKMANDPETRNQLASLNKKDRQRFIEQKMIQYENEEQTAMDIDSNLGQRKTETNTVLSQTGEQKQSAHVDQQVTTTTTGEASLSELQFVEEAHSNSIPCKVFFIRVLALLMGGLVLFLSLFYIESLRLESRLDDYFCDEMSLEDIKQHSINGGTNDACYDTSESVVNSSALWSTDSDGYKRISVTDDAGIAFECGLLMIICLALGMIILHYMIRLLVDACVRGSSVVTASQPAIVTNQWIVMQFVYITVMLLVQSQALFAYNSTPIAYPSHWISALSLIIFLHCFSAAIIWILYACVNKPHRLNGIVFYTVLMTVNGAFDMFYGIYPLLSAIDNQHHTWYTLLAELPIYNPWIFVSTALPLVCLTYRVYSISSTAIGSSATMTAPNKESGYKYKKRVICIVSAVLIIYGSIVLGLVMSHFSHATTYCNQLVDETTDFYDRLEEGEVITIAQPNLFDEKPELFLFDHCMEPHYPFDTICDCKAFYFHFPDNIKWNNVIELKQYLNIDLITALETVMRSFKSLRKLEISGVRQAFDGINHTQTLHQIKDKMSLTEDMFVATELQILILNDIPSTASISGQLGALHKLEYLSIANTEITDLPWSMNDLHRISYFEFSGSYTVNTEITTFPSICSYHDLRGIRIANTQSVDKIPYCVAEFDALEVVFFVNLPALTNISLDVFNLPNLRMLNLEQCSALDIEELMLVTEQETFNYNPNAQFELGLSAMCAVSEDHPTFASFVNTTTACRAVCAREFESECRPSLWGNGVCNPECNNAPCQWDGGDCNLLCASDLSELGNDVCDVRYNTTECNYDQCDCLLDTYFDGEACVSYTTIPPSGITVSQTSKPPALWVHTRRKLSGSGFEVPYDITTFNGWEQMTTHTYDPSEFTPFEIMTNKPSKCHAPTPCIQLSGTDTASDVWIQRHISTSGWRNMMLMYDLHTKSMEVAAPDHAWVAAACDGGDEIRQTMPIVTQGNFTGALDLSSEICNVLTIKIGCYVNGWFDFLWVQSVRIQYATSSPTTFPTTHPTVHPTSSTANPTAAPSTSPSNAPSNTPSASPTNAPSVSPTRSPSTSPSAYPSGSPSTPPSHSPTSKPTDQPSVSPSRQPTLVPTATPTATPSVDPSAHPTLVPTAAPSEDPSAYPTLVPTATPSVDPSAHPTLVPTAAPSEDPSAYPTLVPTATPSVDPSAYPTVDPSSNPSTNPSIFPTLYPSINPSTHPTISPSNNPTIAPSNNPTIAPSNNPTIAPSTNPSTDPSQSPIIPGQPTTAPSQSTNTPTINPSIGPSLHPSINPTQVPTSNPSMNPSQNPMNPSQNPTYHPSNIPSQSPTQIPTHNPSTSPSIIPTQSPLHSSDAPTSNPITSHPTMANQPVFTASFPGYGRPFSVHSFLSDPYGRFEASIEIRIVDQDNALGVTVLCTDCFIWQYRSASGEWMDIDHSNDDDISVHNKQITQTDAITTYQSTLTIQSIRRLNAGRCVDDTTANTRLFTPGNGYELRLKFVVDTDYFVSVTSNVLSIETNRLPSGGSCVVENMQRLKPLQEYNVYCDGWDSEVEYNAMVQDVLMNQASFVSDARQLRSIAPVGNVSIIVLIKPKNESSAITCYPIHAVFKSITNANTDALLSDVSSLTNATSLADNPSVAISLVSVIDDIFQHNRTTQAEAMQIIADIMANVLSGSIMLQVGKDGSISWVVDGHDIISELSMITAITSNVDIVGLESTTTLLVDTYLPAIFGAVDYFIDGSASNNDSNVQDVLYTITTQSQQLIHNLEQTLQSSLSHLSAMASTDNRSNNSNQTSGIPVEVLDSMNHLAQSLVDYANEGAVKALSRSSVGESFNYDNIEYNEDGSIFHKKSIIATKFDANNVDYNDVSIDLNNIELPKCGSSDQSIQLPLSFMQQQDGEFDCALTSNTQNNFLSNQIRTEKSAIVSIDLSAQTGSGRRRLINFESNECFPYLISMALKDLSVDYESFVQNMSLGDAAAFPSCDFWNTNGSNTWDTSGCFVYSISNTSITCGCTHLTSFSLSDVDLIPHANILSRLDWNNITIPNLIKYPTVWLTCLLIFSVFMALCFFQRKSRISSRSILAFEDIIYKSYQQQVLYEATVGKEIKYISDYMPNQQFAGMGIKAIGSTTAAKKSICLMHWKLFTAYLGNEHTLLSVFQRSAGTNFSVRQRLACFFMYLANIMMVTGTFYGLEQSTPTEDIAASFIISLGGTIPVTIVKMFFLKSKSLIVKSKKHSLDDVENPVDSTEGPVDSTEGQQAIAEAVSWRDFDMKGFVKAAQKGITMRDFSTKLGQYYNINNRKDKIRAMSQIRMILFNKMFPLPYKFKKIGWYVLVIWSMIACLVAIVYGLSFDLEATKAANPDNPNLALYQGDCWNTTLALRVESSLSTQQFLQDFQEQQEKNGSSFGGGDSSSWLLSIFTSLFQSMLLWQPLTAYVTTWIKVWLFTWNLKMTFSPGNMKKLIKNCCGRSTDDIDIDSDNEGTLTSHHSFHAHQSYKPAAVVDHEDRPFDLISFLGNSVWIIDDLDEAEYNVYESSRSTQDVSRLDLPEPSKAHEVELQTISEEPDQGIKNTSAPVNDSVIFSLVETMMEEQVVDNGVDPMLKEDVNVDSLLDDIIENEPSRHHHKRQSLTVSRVDHSKRQSLTASLDIDMFVDAVFSENELDMSNDQSKTMDIMDIEMALHTLAPLQE